MYRMGTDSNKKRLDEWINNLPSAQPKRKTGYKINQHQYPAKWVCSECGAKHFDFSDNFCSQCGADVRGEA
jgi:rubrerythrin